MQVFRNLGRKILVYVIIGTITFGLSILIAIPSLDIYLRHRTTGIYEAELRTQLGLSFERIVNILNEAQKQEEPFCSNEDLAHLRAVLLRGSSIRDLGRVSSGRLACTSLLGSLPDNMPILGNGIRLHDGAQLFWRVPLRFAHNEPGFIIEKDNVSAVIDPTLFKGRLSSGISYEVRTKDGEHAGNLPDHFFCFETVKLCASLVFGSPILESIQKRSISGGTLLGGAVTFLVLVSFSFIQGKGWRFRRSLLRALHNGDVYVLYQPIVRLSSGEIIGAEALFRWRDAKLPTERIIERAERFKLTSRITDFVLNQVAIDWDQFATNRPKFYVSVNVSATELKLKDFIPRLSASTAGMPERSIIIELTERQDFTSLDHQAAIQSLRDEGYPVYIDDFGTGFSNISALVNLNVDGIKLDRAITSTEAHFGTLKAVCDLANAQHMSVIAEGIETRAQANALLEIDQCLLGQGWLISRPVFVDELARKLKAQI